MWADSLQFAERRYLLLLLIWAVTSLVLGALLIAWLRTRSWRSPLLQQFSIQASIWGVAEGALSVTLLSRLGQRDLAGATRLDRMVWLSIGLDMGFILAGSALIWSGTRVGQRAGLIGTGAGIVLQGSALAVLHLMLAAQLSR
jgi:hypothetical protein